MAPKLATVEKTKPPAVTPLPDDLFEETLTAATAKPTDESPWERLEATVVSDENQARQLLDFYRAHLGPEASKPMLGVLSHRARTFRRRLLRRERARDDRGAARGAEGHARRGLGLPPAGRRASR